MKSSCWWAFVFVSPLVSGFVQRNPTFCGSALTKPHDITASVIRSNEDFNLPLPKQCPIRKESQARLASRTKDTLDDIATREKYWDFFRIGAAATYIALLIFIFVGPGQIGDPADGALLDKILADPVNPGINPIYFTLFNLFAVVPIILAAVTCPQASKQGLPPGPFLLLSAAIGYLAYGPYLVFRKQPLKQVFRSDLGWITRNIYENKLFGVLTVVWTIIVLQGADALGAYQSDPVGTWQEFVDLMTSSKLCAVSGFDLTILYLVLIPLTKSDYQLRKPEATDDEAWRVASLSALLPFLGSAIYLVLRPLIPEE